MNADATGTLKSRLFLLLLWIRRDLKSRYAGSAAGLLWALLLPLSTIALFYVVFALVLKVRVPELASEAGFFFYLLAGLLPWLSLSDGIARAASVLAGQEQFLQKIVFPVEIMPATAVLTSLVPQLVGTIVFVLLLSAFGLLTPRVLLVPLAFACQVAMTLGAGFALSILGVHLKDLTHIVPVVLQFLFYAAPILYPKTLIPPAYHGVFLLNPVTGLIELYQHLFIGTPLAPMSIMALLAWTALLGGGGWWLFRVLKPTLGDTL